MVHPRRPSRQILFILMQKDSGHQTLGSAGGPQTTPPIGHLELYLYSEKTSIVAQFSVFLIKFGIFSVIDSCSGPAL
jgi:hypothetical protein